MKIPFICIFLSFTISCSENQTSTPSSVTSQKDSTADSYAQLFNIAKIDSKNQRIFVVIDSNSASNIEIIKKIVQELSQQYRFHDDLNITFISESKYAGYKDSLQQENGISYSEFYSNYLGEFNKSSKSYWIFPAIPERKVKYIF